MGGGFSSMSPENKEKMEQYIKEWEEDVEKYGEKQIYSSFLSKFLTVPNHPDPSKYEYKHL